MIIPFALIAFPFNFYGLFQNGDFQIFLLNESALYFFFYGNNGMWYTLEMYILHMLLYGTINNIFFSYLGFDSTLNNKYFSVFIVLLLSIVLCKPIHNSINKLLKNFS